MLILTWKLVDSLIIASNTKTQVYNQSFLLIPLLLLPTNILIEQYCYSCNTQSESLFDKWKASVPTGKQESERLYSSLISQGHPSYFFPHLTEQSSEF